MDLPFLSTFSRKVSLGPTCSFHSTTSASDAFRTCVASYIADLAESSFKLTLLSFPSHPLESESHGDISCCKLCQRTLSSLAAKTLRKSYDDYSSLQSTQRSNYTLYSHSIREQLRLNTFHSTFVSRLSWALQRLHRTIYPSTAELIQASYLFKHLVETHIGCRPFMLLFQESLSTLFLTCLLLSHKYNTDNVIPNKYWAAAIHFHPSILQEFEATVLDLLEWKLSISISDYRQLETIISPVDYSTSSRTHSKHTKHRSTTHSHQISVNIFNSDDQLAFDDLRTERSYSDVLTA